jgi:hypothetical protein
VSTTVQPPGGRGRRSPNPTRKQTDNRAFLTSQRPLGFFSKFLRQNPQQNVPFRFSRLFFLVAQLGPMPNHSKPNSAFAFAKSLTRKWSELHHNGEKELGLSHRGSKETIRLDASISEGAIKKPSAIVHQKNLLTRLSKSHTDFFEVFFSSLYRRRRAGCTTSLFGRIFTPVPSLSCQVFHSPSVASSSTGISQRGIDLQELSHLLGGLIHLKSVANSEDHPTQFCHGRQF